MSSKEADEIKTAFNEIAQGIIRLGSVLATLVGSGRVSAERVAKLIKPISASAAMEDVTKEATLSTPQEASKKRNNKRKMQVTTEEGTLSVEPTESSSLPIAPSSSLPIAPSSSLPIAPSSSLPIAVPSLSEPTATTANKPAKITNVKDPNAPKRPMTSYFLFCKDNRDRIMRENSDMTLIETTKLLGQLWEKADKTQYETEARRLNGIYLDAKKQYLQDKDQPGSKSLEKESSTTALPREGAAAINNNKTIEDASAELLKKKKKKKVSNDATTFIGDKGPFVPIVAPSIVALSQDELSLSSALNSSSLPSQTEQSGQKALKQKKREKEREKEKSSTPAVRAK